MAQLGVRTQIARDTLANARIRTMLAGMTRSALWVFGPLCRFLVFGCALCACARSTTPATTLPPASRASSGNVADGTSSSSDKAGGPKPEAAQTPELIEVRVLTVAYHDTQTLVDRTREQALQRAQMLASLAREGEHLAQLVGEYSDRPGANSDRGVVRLRVANPGPFNEAFVRAALALPVGGVGGPLDEPEGFVVIERLKDPPSGPERISAKHILIGYVDSPKSVGNVTRSEAEARALAQKVLEAARAPGADWDALAAQYTDEQAGKTTGGDLGSFGHGQMVPSFEKAAFALDVGETSDVVKSPFGFHIIRRYR